MANHVIRDRIWVSRKLRRCSLQAALAYPWIFLVADDWGRFEFDPQQIWSRVFGSRLDVSLDDVMGWLNEYERENLLVKYDEHAELAHWTGFDGRPPSKRRPSQYPDPATVKEVPKRKRSGTGRVPVRKRSGTLDQESRSGKQSRRTEAPLPPAAPPADEVFHSPPPANGTTTAAPPIPPARAGGSLADEQVTRERLHAKAQNRNRFEQLRQFAIHAGEHPTDEQLTKFRAWVRSGFTLADMQRRIELGEHLPRAPL